MKQQTSLFRFFIYSICLIIFTLPLTAAEKSTICLNMIVKDEKDVIERALNSAIPFIDTWVIVDTGSTDGTQEIIKNTLKNIPGTLYERPWKNFEHNRNEALSLAKGKADYILILDADDTLESEKGFTLPKNLDKDYYHLWIHLGGTTYTRPQLIKASLPWSWVGVLHEALVCPSAVNSGLLEGLKYVCSRDGARSKDPEKYLKDALVLEEAVKNEPDNRRYIFYLAQSYRDAGKPEESLKWYNKRIELRGWDEEVFWSMLQVAHLQRQLDLPIETVLDSYYRAHRFRPHRVEPLYYMAEIYNQLQNYDLAYATIKYKDFIKQPPQRDLLFNQDWIDDYGIDFQLSIASYYVGKYEESLQCCDKLLKNENIPESWKEITISNRKFPLEKINEKIAK